MPPIEEMEALVAQQGAKVRALKKAKAEPEVIKAEVTKLKTLKADLASQIEATEGPKFPHQLFEETMKRRFFYAPAFEIYGGVGGLYDYGPVGCAIKANVLSTWRQHFVMHDNMLEVACTALSPEACLKASGHVERFTDVMVKDSKTGDCFRADHLLEDVFEEKLQGKDLTADEKAEFSRIIRMADALSIPEMKDIIAKYELKAPVTANELTDPADFNMMFKTSIGPSSDLVGFLRPETAQGIMVCFKRLYDFNNGSLPFAGAQIGEAFRNEISPKQGLLRVREFTMAEIEHFYDPEQSLHPRLHTVLDVETVFYSQDDQTAGRVPQKHTIRKALELKLITNETLAYFIGRCVLFMLKIGIDPERMRFRQHLSTEMAHYASDCWDCELKTSYGWIEANGNADRTCFDLQCHSEASGTPLVATVRLDEPIVEVKLDIALNMGAIGKEYKKNAQGIRKHFAGLSDEELRAIKEQIDADGKTTVTVDGTEFVITKAMIKKMKEKTIKTTERKFYPSVIEPSYGIGRIIYALLEHSFRVRESDEQRVWFQLNPLVAPVKCVICPLKPQDMGKWISTLSDGLTDLNISYRVDEAKSVSIGKRYARSDEIAIPFAVTIDFDTDKDESVTIRDRDSMDQVRVKVTEVPAVVADLSTARVTWASVTQKYGLLGGSKEPVAAAAAAATPPTTTQTAEV